MFFDAFINKELDDIINQYTDNDSDTSIMIAGKIYTGEQLSKMLELLNELVEMHYPEVLL